MTTITTEIALRLADLPNDPRLLKGDLAALLEDRAAARWLAQQLVQVARREWPGRKWTVTDLLDLLHTAVHGPRSAQPTILEARAMRREIRERCRLADRYGEPLGVLVLHFLPDRAAERYATAVDLLLRRLRPEDTVVLFRRHAVFLLPRVPRSDLSALRDRILTTAREALGEAAAADAEACSYGASGDVEEPHALLDWVEDRIR